MFLANLLLTHRNREVAREREMVYAETMEPVVAVPSLLNGFALWNWLLVVLMAMAWAYPIGQFFFMDVHKTLVWGVK
jgi:cytochrome c oxidase subunit 1